MAVATSPGPAQPLAATVAVAVASAEAAVVPEPPQVAAPGLVAGLALAAAEVGVEVAAEAADNEFSVRFFQLVKGAHHEVDPGNCRVSKFCTA